MYCNGEVCINIIRNVAAVDASGFIEDATKYLI
jgi:hypothetical protein